jgi:hypothetical protein
MKKLKLDSDALRVESFEPQETKAAGGTVLAYGTFDTCADIPCDPVPVDWTVESCPPPPTQAYTCAWTCGCTPPPHTQYGWTCDPYMTECLPVPIE